jgi:hypothetical protein
MVKIENIDELRKIKESDYGFVIVIEDKPIIHSTNCDVISEKDFRLKGSSSSIYHWFSTYSLAQTELGDLNSCKVCNPDSE